MIEILLNKIVNPQYDLFIQHNIYFSLIIGILFFTILFFEIIVVNQNIDLIELFKTNILKISYLTLKIDL
ncbi:MULTISPECIES: hypothetical protein [Flavobacterium]|uniref:Uncharacterized protein n=1 Tax=Flavobacterium algoritolerans TaxID=3041254 RepID=A0ABT6VBX3_9FLAO|nr:MULTISPECIES: hypothetical protein [Flavobacterium]MDI5888817.1 hypothetical protein [Flavobacterium yafengii]MDI5895753.1 hypothetical protein [Flavobacterium algoritolerans]